MELPSQDPWILDVPGDSNFMKSKSLTCFSVGILQTVVLVYFPGLAQPSGMQCPRAVNNPPRATILEGPLRCCHHEAFPPPVTRCFLSRGSRTIYLGFAESNHEEAAYSIFFLYKRNIINSSREAISKFSAQCLTQRKPPYLPLIPPYPPCSPWFLCLFFSFPSSPIFLLLLLVFLLLLFLLLLFFLPPPLLFLLSSIYL